MKKAQYRQKNTRGLQIRRRQSRFQSPGRRNKPFWCGRYNFIFVKPIHVATSHPEDYSYITSYLLLVGVT